MVVPEVDFVCLGGGGVEFMQVIDFGATVPDLLSPSPPVTNEYSI